MARRGQTTDVFQLLIRDHQEILEKFEAMDLVRTRAAAGDEKRELLRELSTLLMNHFRLEEEHFYPQIKGIKQVRDAVDEAVAEHEELRRILSDLESIDPDSDRWEERFDRLESMRDDHFAVEETEIFAEARDHLRGNELILLGERVAAERDEIMRRTPHLPEQGKMPRH